MYGLAKEAPALYCSHLFLLQKKRCLTTITISAYMIYIHASAISCKLFPPCSFVTCWKPVQSWHEDKHIRFLILGE